MPGVRSHAPPGGEQKGYFLLDFLVVDFFEDFLELFFLAMALSPPFVARIYELQK